MKSSPDLGKPAVAPVVAFLFVLALAASAVAHPPPAAQAVFTVADAGAFELVIRCDVAALAMQAPPGHLGEMLLEELQSMPLVELAQRLADVRRSLEFYTKFAFDGRPAESLQAGERDTGRIDIELPSPEALRAASPHADVGDFQTIRLRGKLPRAAQQLRITFPEALGRVELIYTPPGQGEVRVRLSAGATTPPIPLSAEAARETPAARPAGATAADIVPLALLLLAVLALLCGSHLKRLWRR